jgi:choline-sulfatase/uncharacterized sulfatase
MLSSLYPSTFGYYGLYGREPDFPMTNLLGYLREHGYRTGAVGKLHTPRYWLERDCQFIYDEFIEYPKYLEALGLYEENDGRNFTGKKEMYSEEGSAIPLEHSVELVAVKQALRFINNEGEPKDRGKARQPWFLWLSFSRPHEPCVPSNPFDAMYNPENLTLPPAGEAQDKGQQVDRDHHGNSLNNTELRLWLSKYYGVLSQMDYAIGKLLEELEQRGQLDNTIILYTADHGDYAGEHRRMEKNGGISYRAITGIPLMISAGLGDGGSISDGMVEAVDIFPTLCECVDIDIPSSVQGKSLAPMLQHPRTEIKTSSLTENPYRKSIATRQWRYVANVYHQGERDELYDLDNDPWELRNCIDDPESQSVREEMSRMLLDRVVQARKPITVMNGGWHDHVYDRDGRIDIENCGGITPYW